MRIAILICLLGFCSCQSWETSRKTAPDNVTVAVKPTAEVTGKIVNVRLQGGFVVIDFGGKTVPSKGTKLGLWRGGQKIGRVEMTEPSYPPFGAANILEGIPEVGDTVR